MDIFGERVEFTFRKKTKFKTWIGASISCIMCSFFFTFLVLRTVKLVTSDDPFFSLTTMGVTDQNMDIWKLDFMFAVENIDPRAGRISAQHVTWDNSGE